MVQSLPGDRGMRRLPRPQSSVLAVLGFLLQGFSPRMHGSRVAATGDLRGSWTSCLRVWKAT
ncbi:hypothetical protein FOXYSP1_20342 [Fusarium oxysporum f. sp. phaseoli]